MYEIGQTQFHRTCSSWSVDALPVGFSFSAAIQFHQDRGASLLVNLGGGFCWVHGGLGEGNPGVSGGISLSYRKGSNLFTIRAVETSEFELYLWGYTGPLDEVWDVGVLYGRITKSDRGMASLSGGVGIVGASDYGRAASHRAGIPIEAQLFWIASDRLGLGIYGFANVNSDRSFAGALFCLQIGKLR